MDPVTVCNIALGALGQDRIDSTQFEDPDDTSSQMCATFFDICVRAALEDVAPLFATGFIDLGARQDSDYAKLSTNKNADVALLAKFTLDLSKVVRPLACDDGSGEFLIKWEQNGAFILSEDTDKLLCRAVLVSPDPNLWNPSFVFAAAYRLASEIAGPITHSAAIEKDMNDRYMKARATAANLDAFRSNQTPQMQRRTDTLANRR